MKKRVLINLIGFVLLMLAIGYGGPYISSLLNKRYRQRIDNNSVTTKAFVYKKNSHKGKTVHFRYYFKNKVYNNNEQNSFLFKQLSLGDSIYILLDSTNPSASYILKS